jgi:diaminopimelate epimerase
VPHLVIVVDDVEQVPLTTRGRTLRFHPALAPHGANVNFVSQGRGSSEWRMRTYERGVEGETLACGTGAVAAACALSQWDLAQLPTVFVTSSGRRLDVRAVRIADERYDDVWLGGEARMVFRGVLT